MAESNAREPENGSATSLLLLTGVMLVLYFGYQQFFASPPPTRVASSAAAMASTANVEALRAARLGERRTAELRTEDYIATLDNLAGGLSSFRLTAPRFSNLDLVTTQLEDFLPLRVTLEGVAVPPDVVWQVEPVEGSERGAVRLRWHGDGVEVVRQFEPGRGPYQLWQTVSVRNEGSSRRPVRPLFHAFHYVRRDEESTGFLSFGQRPTAISSGFCLHAAEVTRKDRAALASAHGYAEAQFAGIENTYFAQVVAADDPGAERCGMWAQDRFASAATPDGTLFETQLRYAPVELAPGETRVWRTVNYFGPKEWDALQAAGHDLDQVVNLGMFAVIARQFSRALALIHGVVGNWGLAIILLTFCVRVLLYPVMARQFKAFAPMRKLKPEMDAIQAKFPDDMERRNAAIMELYRKHGVNPAAQMLGCLPVLLQMPVFFALYTALSTSVELYNQPFALWLQNLSARDPYFILPIALTLLMHVQQRLMPAQGDPVQQKMMLFFMPAMMGLFMLFLPSGLALYMLTNSSLSIAQQRYNEWRWQQAEAAASKATTTEAPRASASDGTTTSRRPPRG